MKEAEPGFIQEIKDARKQISALCEVMPHLFPQYQNLLHARDKYEKAKVALEKAELAWDNFRSAE